MNIRNRHLILLAAVLAGCSTTPLVSPKSQNLASQDIHQQALVIDAHADIEIPSNYSIYVGEDGRSRVEPAKLRVGQVDAVVMTISKSLIPRTAEGYAAARATANEELQAVLDLTADPDDDLVLIKSSSELVTSVEHDQHGLILGFQNAAMLGEDVDGIDEFYAAGVRMFALTHLGHNSYADSSRPFFIAELGKHEPESEHGGLSDLGRQAIQRINELGAMVDVSQLSKQATLQAAALSTAPVIASHSNVRAITDVTRSLSNEEIDLIAEKGGVVHVTPFRAYMYDSSDAELDTKIRAARRTAGIMEDYYYPFELYWEMDDPIAKRTFLTTVSDLIGPGSLDLLVDHIDYIVQRVGIEHVGIGSDFNHGGGVEGFQDASEAANITTKLIERGYTQEQINLIWGGNFLRVWKAAEQASRHPAN